jgi:ABC-2 type transport system permease protein
MTEQTLRVAPARRARVELGPPSWWRTAQAICRFSVVRTLTPVLLITMSGLVLLPMLFGLVFASRGYLSGDPVSFLVQRYDQLVSALATPLIALLLSTSAFSAESDDGTLLYLVTTTTPRWWIVCVRVCFAALGTALASAVAVFGTGLIVTGAHDPDHITRAFGIAAAFGGAAYAALFTLLALLTRRALVSGLLYVVFWEGVLSSTFPALHFVSVRQWMLAVASALTTSKDAHLAEGPSLTASLIGASIVLVIAVVAGSRQLSEPRIGRVGT